MQKINEYPEHIMNECKNCEHCNIYTNTCLIDDSKCYDKGKLLRENCKFFEDGKWTDVSEASSQK